MEQLDDVLNSKIDELNQLSVTDDGFKDAASAVCNLAETNAKIDNYKTDKKVKWWQLALAALAGAAPFILNYFDHQHYDQELNKVLEYERTGGIISSGSKSVLSGLRIGKK